MSESQAGVDDRLLVSSCLRFQDKAGAFFSTFKIKIFRRFKSGTSIFPERENPLLFRFSSFAEILFCPLNPAHLFVEAQDQRQHLFTWVYPVNPLAQA
jgi:hypothetical protein